MAEVRVTHFSPPDEITYEISASGNSHTPIPGNIKDGAPYFSLHQRGPNALKVYLTKSLEEDLKVSTFGAVIQVGFSGQTVQSTFILLPTLL